MTLGEIKIETLKLMFTNLNNDIIPEKLNNYKLDENYSGYLINMPGAINRCFSSLEEKRVLPSRSEDLNPECEEKTSSYWRYDLGDISDFFDIERIVRISSDGEYDSNCEWHREANTLVLEINWVWDSENNKFISNSSYTLIYKPRLDRINSATEETKDLNIPDYIASYIPYFLKGDLYRDDEPNEAAEARNWYEQAMEEIMMREEKTHQTNRVKEVYSQI